MVPPSWLQQHWHSQPSYAVALAKGQPAEMQLLTMGPVSAQQSWPSEEIWYLAKHSNQQEERPAWADTVAASAAAAKAILAVILDCA